MCDECEMRDEERGREEGWMEGRDAFKTRTHNSESGEKKKTLQTITNYELWSLYIIQNKKLIFSFYRKL